MTLVINLSLVNGGREDVCCVFLVKDTTYCDSKLNVSKTFSCPKSCAPQEEMPLCLHALQRSRRCKLTYFRSACYYRSITTVSKSWHWWIPWIKATFAVRSTAVVSEALLMSVTVKYNMVTLPSTRTLTSASAYWCARVVISVVLWRHGTQSSPDSTPGCLETLISSRRRVRRWRKGVCQPHLTTSTAVAGNVKQWRPALSPLLHRWQVSDLLPHERVGRLSVYARCCNALVRFLTSVFLWFHFSFDNRTTPGRPELSRSSLLVFALFAWVLAPEEFH